MGATGPNSALRIALASPPEIVPQCLRTGTYRYTTTLKIKMLSTENDIWNLPQTTAVL